MAKLFNSLRDGENFRYQGRDYVKTAEMRLSVGRWSLITNCLFLAKDSRGYDPPVFQTDYMLESTVVETPQGSDHNPKQGKEISHGTSPCPRPRW
jgi:hypothetical protein